MLVLFHPFGCHVLVPTALFHLWSLKPKKVEKRLPDYKKKKKKTGKVGHGQGPV